MVSYFFACDFCELLLQCDCGGPEFEFILTLHEGLILGSVIYFNGSVVRFDHLASLLELNGIEKSFCNFFFDILQSLLCEKRLCSTFM